MKKFIGLFFVLAFLVGCGWAGMKILKYYKEPVPSPVNVRSIVKGGGVLLRDMSGLEEFSPGVENTVVAVDSAGMIDEPGMIDLIGKESNIDEFALGNDTEDTLLNNMGSPVENDSLTDFRVANGGDVGTRMAGDTNIFRAQTGGGIMQNGENQNTFPDELNLSVPFYPQAPHANWDYPWEEACEEASVLLVANEYFGHNWSRDQFNEEILKLVEWEKKMFGDYLHTTVDETAQILTDYFDLEVKIHEDPSFDDFRRILAGGHLIVAPFAGKHLYNPFYKNGGPNYHMMVVKGYKNGNKIITHDVGTRRGADYVYTWDVIDSALHDYADPIESGARKIIEILPPFNE